MVPSFVYFFKSLLCVAGGAARVVRGARGGRAGRAHHRAAGAEARAAAALGAPPVVDRPGSLRRLHSLRGPIQHIQWTGRRIALHAARPAARCGVLT